MPKLRRVRFLSIGHPNARMDDLTLNFQDLSGNAGDSTLWLRNGGGKSSILNLCFACIRTGRREFLGGKAESKRRRLEDYVRASDRSAVVCEWEFAAEDGGEPRHLLTGVFYEWRSGKGSSGESSHENNGKAGSKLHRLFFGTRVLDTEPELTLDGLPFFTSSRGNRRTFTSFKKTWHQLEENFPEQKLLATQNQKHWNGWLERQGVDAELFAYQIRMNQREGAADELFRFQDDEEFIDFLLELVHDPKFAEELRLNLNTFREDLSLRKNQLLPEQELVRGMMETLEPLESLAQERKKSEQTIVGTFTRLQQLEAYVRETLDEYQRAKQQATSHLDQTRQEMRDAKQQTRTHEQSAAALNWWCVSSRLNGMKNGLKSSEEKRHAATERVHRWEAAIPLRNALRAETQAANSRHELQRKQSESEPKLNELQQVATWLSKRIDEQLHALKVQAVGQQTEIERASQQAERLREQSHACELESLAARKDAERREEQLHQSENELNALRQQHVLQDEETPAEALERLRNLTSSQQQEHERLQRQLVARERQVDELAREQVLAKRQFEERERELEIVQGDYQKAVATRDALECELLLQQVLQVERVHLEQLTEHSLVTLTRTITRQREQVVKLRMQQAETERSIQHLEQFGLLPPSADVLQILEILKARYTSVWSGWEYLEQQVPAHTQRAFLNRHPYLAQGVLISHEHFAAACELLEQRSPKLSEPVLIADTSRLNEQPTVIGKVIAPVTEAHFSRPAAREELQRLRTLQLEQAEQLQRLMQKQYDLEQLLAKLKQYFASTPAGWFGKHRENQSRLQSQLTALETSLQSVGEMHDRYEAETEQFADDLRAIEQCQSETEKQWRAIEQFQTRIGCQLAAWESQAESARQTERQRQSEQEQFLQESRELWQEVERGRTSSLQSQRQMTALEIERGQLEYVSKSSSDSEVHSPQSLPLDQLRQRYRQLKTQYEREVSHDGLLMLAEEQEETARRERQKLLPLLQQHELTEPTVAALLETLADPDDAEQSLREAHRQLVSAQGEWETARQQVQRLEEKLRETHWHCSQLQLSETEREQLLGSRTLLEADELEQLAQEERTRAREHEQRAEQLRLEVNGAERKLQQVEQSARTLSQDSQRLNMLIENHEDWLAEIDFASVEVSDDTSEHSSLNFSMEEVANLTNQIERELHLAKQKQTELNRQRQQFVKALRGFVSREKFQQLGSRLVLHVMNLSEDDLETHAAHDREELSLRLQTITQQLSSVNAHRNVLIQELSHLVDDGLHLLTTAGNQSRLPEHVPGLGGSQFLKMTWETIDDPRERQECLGLFLDQLIEGEEIPDSLTLFQRAIRAMIRPVKVRVLNPDPQASEQYVPIPDVSKFSGGEQLTCAILLYCTLAQLRTRQRGTSEANSTSVLVLDNPIGKASRVRFLELQRDVARAMGIQLIYTTAVNDYEALRILPNVIRLRNTRIDRRTGHRIIEPDAQIPEPIDTEAPAPQHSTRIDVAQLTRKTVQEPK